MDRTREWLTERWPGTVPASGFALAIFEFGAKLLLGRPIDPEVVPLAVALIMWRPVRQRQRKRNGRRED